MKKRNIMPHVIALDKRLDRLERETAIAITNVKLRVEALLDRVEDIRNMVAEVADRPEWKSDALPADINAALAKDVADLGEGPRDDEWFFGLPPAKARKPFYGKSPLDIVKAAQALDVDHPFEPTDEELDQIDQLVEELIADHE